MAATPSFNDSGTSECMLSVKNGTGQQVQLIWSNFEGEEQVYNVIEASNEVQQNTFSTHTWILRTDDGKLLLRYAGPSATLSLFEDGGVSVSVASLPPQIDPL